MNKKRMAALAAVLVALLMAAMLPALAESASDGDGAVEYRNVRLNVNGERVLLIDENDEQQKSIIADGQVYVPVETFVSALGGTTIYSAEENQLVIVLPLRETGSAAAEGMPLPVEPEADGPEMDGPEDLDAPSAGDPEAEEAAAPAENTETAPVAAESAQTAQPDATAEPEEASGPDLTTNEGVTEVLMSGRWVWADPAKGNFSFLEFGKKNKGSIMTMTDFTWKVENRLVTIKYKTDKEYTKTYTFEQDGNDFTLVGEDDRVYVLNGRQDPRAQLIGTWHANVNEAMVLEVSVTGEFSLKVVTTTYTGKWSLNGTRLILSTQGIEVTGTYDGSKISLNMSGRSFTFTR